MKEKMDLAEGVLAMLITIVPLLLLIFFLVNFDFQYVISFPIN